MELSIDTSTRYAFVALSKQGEVTIELTWRSERNHSVEYVPAFKMLMEQSNVAIADIDAVFVARGPGQFSALRVGMSFAKALAMARTLPLISVGTLEVEAYPYVGLGLPVCAMISAGRSKVYTGIFDSDSNISDNSPNYVVKAHADLTAGLSQDTIFCGEAVQELRPLLDLHPRGRAILAECHTPTRRPGSLAQIAYRRMLAADTDDPATLEPLYMGGAQFTKTQYQAGTT